MMTSPLTVVKWGYHTRLATNGIIRWLEAHDQVMSPYGEIPWHQVGRISDEEMRRLMEDIVNRLYTFLFHLLTSGEPERGVPLPKNWSPPQIEASIAEMGGEDERARDDNGTHSTHF